jgi:hypothetical protein
LITPDAGGSANLRLNLTTIRGAAQLDMETPDNYPTVRPSSQFNRFTTVYPRVKDMFTPQVGAVIAVSYAQRKRLSILSRFMLSLKQFRLSRGSPRDFVSGVRTEYDAIGSQYRIRHDEERQQRKVQALEYALKLQRHTLETQEQPEDYRNRLESTESSERYWEPTLVVKQDADESWTIHVKSVRSLEMDTLIDPQKLIL